MATSSLNRRLGRSLSKPALDVFPDTSRRALGYLFVDLRDRGYLVSEERIIRELDRTGRFTSEEIEGIDTSSFINRLVGRLYKLPWYLVYAFCERTYLRLLTPAGDFDDFTPLDEVRQYYTQELNLILEEDNLGFTFLDGQFVRRGRPQTQKAIERAESVLSQPRMAKARTHYNKARSFFNRRPEPDIENCVKEAMCALEAAVAIHGKDATQKDFDRALVKLQGTQVGTVPPPIVQSVLKLHGYRGTARGVAHAALAGASVTIVEAELVLSVVASFITYLADLFPPKDEIPF